MSMGFPSSSIREPVLCVPHTSVDNMWGYVIGSAAKIRDRAVQTVYRPFGYRKYVCTNTRIAAYDSEVSWLYVLRRKPFNVYTHHITDGIKLRPLKEDFIVVTQASIIKLLERLTLEYKHQYVIRRADNNYIASSLLHSRPIQDVHLLCSIYRVQDVLPPDINNTDGLCVKIYDNSHVYLDIVFSNNANMYDTDGFVFKNNIDFNTAINTVETTIDTLEKLKAGKRIAPKKRRKKTSKITHSTYGNITFTVGTIEALETNTNVTWTENVAYRQPL